jgi:CheY-like chemotaxis protein
MKVLVADDNPVFQSMLRTLLTKWGYEVAMCADGNEAWAVIQSTDAPRLLVLDWMMPGLDGIELCRRIRAANREPYLYIIMLTARVESVDLVEAMEAGCDDYITKPFNAHELRVRLRAGCRILDVIEEREALSDALYAPSSREYIYPSCFLSHSTRDSGFVQVFFSMLDTEGVSCWYAPQDLRIGSDLRETLDEVIREKDKLLLVLSEHSVRSAWVGREVERALDVEHTRRSSGRADWRILFPIRLDDCIFEIEAGWALDVRRRHIGDFRNWRDADSYQEAFQRLLRDLKAEKEKRSSSRP